MLRCLTYNFYPPPLYFSTDSMGEEHHTWGTSWIFTLMVVVCIHRFSLSLFLFLDHTHTYRHTHLFSGAHIHTVVVLLKV